MLNRIIIFFCCLYFQLEMLCKEFFLSLLHFTILAIAQLSIFPDLMCCILDTIQTRLMVERCQSEKNILQPKLKYANLGNYGVANVSDDFNTCNGNILYETFPLLSTITMKYYSDWLAIS